MKPELYTVESIFNKMNRLKEELAELKEAKDLLYEEQDGGVAHKLVKSAYDKAYQELNIYKRTKFVEYIEESILTTGELFD